MRWLTSVLVLAVRLLPTLQADEPERKPGSPATVKQRKAAIDRPRRILFNNDGGEPRIIQMATSFEHPRFVCVN